MSRHSCFVKQSTQNRFCPHVSWLISVETLLCIKKEKKKKIKKEKKNGKKVRENETKGGGDAEG